MELGLYTFADVGPGGDPARRMRELVEEIELADKVGLDVFDVGEHHHPDYAVSSPAVALAAAAARTENMPEQRGYRAELGRPPGGWCCRDRRWTRARGAPPADAALAA